MDCRLAQEQAMLAVYGELSEAQTGELDRHLAECPACRAELADLEELLRVADARTAAEPDANLVARARMRLDEAIEELPPERWTGRLATKISNGFFGLRAAPLAACSLLVLGIAGGAGAGFELAQLRAPHAAAVAVVAQNAPQPQAQQKAEPVQTAAVQAEAKPRTDAKQERGKVELLAANCRTQRGCKDEERATLIAALRGNSDPAVRETALEGLEPYVTEDLRVRNAVLRALLNDRDARIRSASIQLLEPIDADTSVRQVLYSVSTSDANPQIRNVSRQVLSRMPEIQ
jgi:anti-sigma factor RsiW